MGKISIAFWKARGISSACCIRVKPISLPSHEDSERKQNKLDASTIARILLSGEARRGYVPTELITTYRELVRLHSQLSDEVTRYKNEIHALLIVLFPEFSQIFSDPCRPTALGILKRYPSAQAIAAAGVEVITATLQELAPRHYGRNTAEQLVNLAENRPVPALPSPLARAA